MKRNFLINKKAQFFIASAVIIIFVITAIFFFIARVGQVSNPQLLQRELSFFTLNVKEEFGRIVEISLSDVSQDISLNPNDYLNANLSSFSRYVQTQGMQRGIIVNVSAASVSASNSSMNATLYLSLLSQGATLESNSYIYRAIDISPLTEGLAKTPSCALNVTAKKEFWEPISGLNISNFGFKINSTACASPSYSEISVGKYTATCSSSTCVSSTVTIEVTDHRNIFGFGTIPNTGAG